MRASKIWEKVLDFLSLDRRSRQGEGIGLTLTSDLALHSTLRVFYLSPIDFRPDDLDLLWKRSR